MTTRADREPASVSGMTVWRVPRAYLRARPLLADAILAVVLYTGATLLWVAGDRAAWPVSWPVGLAWSALSMATVVIRRKATWLAIGALAVHIVVSLLVPHELQVDPLAMVLLTYTAAGLFIGVGLGLVGLRLTRWEPSVDALHYTPNRLLVLTLMLIVAGRVLYGLWRGWHSWSAGLHGESWFVAAGVPGSMAAGGVVLGYYLAYWAGVRRRYRRHATRRLRRM